MKTTVGDLIDKILDIDREIDTILNLSDHDEHKFLRPCVTYLEEYKSMLLNTEVDI